MFFVSNLVKEMNFEEALWNIHPPYDENDTRATRIAPIVGYDKHFVGDSWHVLRTIRNDFDDVDYEYKHFWNAILTLKYRSNSIKVELACGAKAWQKMLALLLVRELISLNDFRSIEGTVDMHNQTFSVQLSYDSYVESQLMNLRMTGLSHSNEEIEASTCIEDSLEALARLCELQHP